MRGRGFLALDWGKRKVGYATADEAGIVITPRSHFIRKQLLRAPDANFWRMTQNDQRQLEVLLEEYDCGTIILGLPLGLNGEETEAATGARWLQKQLEDQLKVKVHLINEALSSWEAQDNQKQSPRKSKNSPSEDARAAASLLKDFFAQKDSSSRSGRILLPVLGVFFLLAVLTVGFAGFKYYRFALTPANESGTHLEDTFMVDVPPGSHFHGVNEQLKDKGVEIDPFIFKIWARLSHAGQRLQVGEFEINRTWSQKRILEEILSGQVARRFVTIKEGDNIWDVKNLLLANTPFTKTSEDFLSVTRDPALLKRMGVPQHSEVESTLEGFLFPETYAFQKYDSTRFLVESMLSEFEKRALPILKQHPWGQTPEGRYRLLTLASIVEKESGDFAEQPLIASVFWNRLKKKMRLESDPTIIYGLLPDFDGNIRRSQIRQPHPYNTYTIRELPVGPIANPGESALKAVVNPAQTDYLFFVSKGDGSHVFSTDYKTHAKYVREYQIKRSSRTSSQ